MKLHALRLSSIGLLTGALLLPSIANAQSATETGTIEGTVTCGTQPGTTPSGTEVWIEGIDLSTRTGEGGHFVLSGVPTNGPFTLNVSDVPADVDLATMPGLSVGTGQTLDVGTIDVSTCPTVAPDTDFGQPAPV